MPRFRINATLYLENGADTRAPGGAVTCALCGHWDHEGACRWPHFNQIQATDSHYDFWVDVTCSDDDLSEVVQRVSGALHSEQSRGPDGVLQHWRLIALNEAPQRLSSDLE